MSDEMKSFLFGLAALTMLTIFGVRSCNSDDTINGRKAAVRVECLREGHAVLECEKL